MGFDIFEKFYQLNIDMLCIGMEESDYSHYYCDPVGVKTFAGLYVDGIHFCFIDGFGEMVFSVSPEGVAPNVNPLAYNFTDFLRLVLACKNSSPIEQIYWMSKEQFTEFMAEEFKNIFPEQEHALAVIQSELNIEPMPDPYEYVRGIQTAFDYSKIEYTDEYYECSGLDRP